MLGFVDEHFLMIQAFLSLGNYYILRDINRIFYNLFRIHPNIPFLTTQRLFPYGWAHRRSTIP
jgi:hypothetical protein